MRGDGRGWLIALLGLWTTVCEAQGPRNLLRIGAGAGEGRLALRTALRVDRPSPESSLASGLAVDYERRVRRRFAVRTGAAWELFAGRHLSVLDLYVGPVTSVRIGDGHEFVLHSGAVASVSAGSARRAGVGLQLTFGYAHVRPSGSRRFVDFVYRVRAHPDITPSFAAQTFPSYGFHPEDRATLFASYLGVIGGVGFGIGR